MLTLVAVVLAYDRASDAVLDSRDVLEMLGFRFSRSLSRMWRLPTRLEKPDIRVTKYHETVGAIEQLAIQKNRIACKCSLGVYPRV